jgi:hypothetical protein
MQISTVKDYLAGLINMSPKYVIQLNLVHSPLLPVAIRMRPVEGNTKTVWKVFPDRNSAIQTTNTNDTFTFDKVFGEDTKTKQVYDSIAKGIVSLAVNGLNGAMFAYGQTASGKTFTMQGSGESQESQSDGGSSIMQLAARDIFSHIQSQSNRRFKVLASTIEIYNESVHDLLSPLREALVIFNDSEVKSVKQEAVTDCKSLLNILLQGQKSQTISETPMNKSSYCSHTIFRITIESHEKECGNGENGENRPPSEDRAIRVSTLNLVDLAGFESV